MSLSDVASPQVFTASFTLLAGGYAPGVAFVSGVAGSFTPAPLANFNGTSKLLSIVRTATGGTPGTLHADWPHARNAARYHVWLFIVGVDTAYRNVATANDTDATLTGLPSGKTAKIQITSVNDAGESGPSAEVSAVVG